MAAELDDVGVSNASLFRAEVSSYTRYGDPVGAWDLRELRGRYEAFIRRFTPYRGRLRGGRIKPREALVDRTRIMDAWRSFPREDPDLPSEFLPSDWPRRDARELFLEIYEGLGAMAERRVNEIVAETGDEETPASRVA